MNASITTEHRRFTFLSKITKANCT